MNNEEKKSVVYAYDSPDIREDAKKKALEIKERTSAENIIEARSISSGRKYKINGHTCTIALVEYSPND